MNHQFQIAKLAFLFLLTFTSCDDCEYRKGVKEYREFVDAPFVGIEEGSQRFSTYSIDQQIDIYLYARGCPDNPQIDKFLVKNGEKKIPIIVERIKSEDRLSDKRNLISILIDINQKCKCIDRDSSTIRSLQEVKRKIENDSSIPSDNIYKKSYSDWLKILEEQTVK